MRRFYTLDAMRGIAALAVFAGHSGQLIAPIQLSHSMLAVDLFFMLSGYVIDRSYRDRLTDGMMPLDFMISRLVRLYPLYILGGLIGIGGAFITLIAGESDYNLGSFITASFFTMLMLPSPTWNSNIAIMPMNIPAWSLLFELFANLVFALFVTVLTTKRLLLICAASAIWLASVSIAQDGLHDGYSWDYPSAGFPRVLFGFFAGVLIQRAVKERCIVTKWAYVLPLAILPLFTGYGGGVGDAVKVIAIFPLLIIIAASVEPPKMRLFTALGLMSYPFYALHVPILQNLERALTVLHVERSAMAPWIGLSLGMVLIVISLLADRLYDQPVRRWLSTVILEALSPVRASRR